MPDWGGEAAHGQLCAALSFVEFGNIMSRTIVYIDGYNLYYSRLRGSPYKWLDLVSLFRNHILHAQMPDAEIAAVKYFTAPAMRSLTATLRRW